MVSKRARAFCSRASLTLFLCSRGRVCPTLQFWVLCGFSAVGRLEHISRGILWAASYFLKLNKNLHAASAGESRSNSVSSSASILALPASSSCSDFFSAIHVIIRQPLHVTFTLLGSQMLRTQRLQPPAVTANNVRSGHSLIRHYAGLSFSIICKPRYVLPNPNTRKGTGL